METRTLRKLQQPSGVEELLDAYIADSGLLPRGAHQIRDRAELSQELRRIVVLATHTGQAWACWTRNAQTWLFTAEMSLDLSRERGTPVLQISRYGDDGVLEGFGCWMADQKGKWHRCAD